MTTSIVTGGAGFLGSHLCEALLAEGERVICIDNLDTGSLQNVEHIDNDAFTFVLHDLTEPFFIDEPVDFVYHLASPASPIDYLRLPLHTLKVGSYGTHHMLGLAKLKRARFVLASTSEVYGDPQVHPQPEEYWGHVNPIGPRGVYDEAKRYAEALTMAYHRQQGVDTGNRQDLQHLRAEDAPARRPRRLDLPAPGAPGQAAHRLRRRHPDPELLLRRRPGPRLHAMAASDVHVPVNIGNPEELTLLELAETVIEVTRVEVGDRLRGAADRRPAGPPARHHPREAAPRTGSRRSACATACA